MKFSVSVAIVVLMTSVAAAQINSDVLSESDTDSSPVVRQNGILDSLTIIAQQVGPLEVRIDASVTTQGGDGAPAVVTYNGNTYTLNNQVWLYAQIYDSPWNGGCSNWTTSPGTDWCAAGEEFFLNSPVALGSFALSFTTTAPEPAYYQTFVAARAGLTWITTAFPFFSVSQTVASSAVETIYISGSTPPDYIFSDDFETGDTTQWSDVES